MSYAVIQLQGKQFRVSPGEKLVVDRLADEDGAALKVTDVLLVGEGDNVTVGTPFVKGATVEMTVEAKTRGEKIRVFKYKSKSRYRKTRGHRQDQTILTVKSINS